MGGMENCFVSLPLVLIQTLERRPGFASAMDRLPEILVLELRNSSSDEVWTVSWSGATSTSSAIEVLPLLRVLLLLLLQFLFPLKSLLIVLNMLVSFYMYFYYYSCSVHLNMGKVTIENVFFVVCKYFFSID